MRWSRLAGFAAVATLAASCGVQRPTLPPTSTTLAPAARAASDRAMVAATARRFVTELTTFRWSTLDTNLRAVRADATGRFAADASQFFGAATAEQLIATHAVSRGVIRSLGISVDENAGMASGDAIVDQVITSDKEPLPQTDHVDLKLALLRQLNGWRVADVNLNPVS